MKLECTETVEATGFPVSVVGWTISSHMTRGAERIILVVGVINALQGRYDITLAAIASLALTEGNWKCDIRRQDGLSVDISDTFAIVVEGQVTNA